MRRRDQITSDLFDWTPPRVAVDFDEDEIKGTRLGSRISRAIALALKGKSRRAVAERMSADLGYPTSVDMLDAYASEAKDGHRITAERLIALIAATECFELLGFIAGQFEHIVVPMRYQSLIELHEIGEHEKEVIRRREVAEARWRAQR